MKPKQSARKTSTRDRPALLRSRPYSINICCALFTSVPLFLSFALPGIPLPLGCLMPSSVLNHGSNPLHSLKSEAEFSKLQPCWLNLTHYLF